jgi:thiamine monophosphate kinase
MARWEQFEVWVRSGDNWELIAAFADFQVAQAVAHGRHTGVRLVHTVIEDGKEVQRDTLAEIGGGAVREHPEESA